MKKIYSLASACAMALMLQACGTSAGSATDNSQTVATTSVLGNVLTSLLTNLTTNTDITGTWTYSGPKIVFESENILSQLGSTVASSKMESMLSNQLSKIGFSSKSKLTLNSDKTYTFTVGSRDYAGTYTYDTSLHQLTLTGALGLTNYTCTAAVKNGELYMLHDANSLLSLATKLSSSSKNTTLSTLSTLLGSYSGLKLGWTMKK